MSEGGKSKAREHVPVDGEGVTVVCPCCVGEVCLEEEREAVAHVVEGGQGAEGAEGEEREDDALAGEERKGGTFMWTARPNVTEQGMIR